MLTHLTDLYGHLKWADAELWRALEAAPRTHADAGVHARLYHIHAVQHAYAQIWSGQPPDLPAAEALPGLAALRAWAIQGHRELDTVLARLDESALDRPVDLPWKAHAKEPATLAETLLQVAMHSAYHRGQSAMRVRDLGGEPPLTDYVAWIWMGRPAASWDGATKSAAPATAPESA